MCTTGDNWPLLFDRKIFLVLGDKFMYLYYKIYGFREFLHEKSAKICTSGFLKVTSGSHFSRSFVIQPFAQGQMPLKWT